MKEAISIIVLVLAFMGFSAWLYKSIEGFFEARKEERKQRESQFDYDAFNQENFGI